LDDLGILNVGIFLAIFNSLRHLVLCMAIWYIYGHLVYSWPFGIFMAIWYIHGHLVYLLPFCYIYGH
jgi:hypothetical protein